MEEGTFKEGVILECPIRVRITSPILEFLNENFQGRGVYLIRKNLLVS